MANLNVKHYLDVYTTKREMQEQGITNPSDTIKEFTRTFVEKLQRLPLNDAITLKDNSFFDSKGELIITIPTDHYPTIKQ
jgi:hypothetical protein